jgi:hypothetical protein
LLSDDPISRDIGNRVGVRGRIAAEEAAARLGHRSGQTGGAGKDREKHYDCLSHRKILRESGITSL